MKGGEKKREKKKKKKKKKREKATRNRFALGTCKKADVDNFSSLTLIRSLFCRIMRPYPNSEITRGLISGGGGEGGGVLQVSRYLKFPRATVDRPHERNLQHVRACANNYVHIQPCYPVFKVYIAYNERISRDEWECKAND